MSQHDGLPEFEAFYEKEWGSVVAFLRYLGASPPDAQDVAQDAFAHLYRCWHRVDTPTAWIRKTASRELGHRRRRAATEQKALDANPPPDEAEDGDEGGAASIYTDDRFTAAIAALSARQRQVVAWRLAGFSNAETARELGMTPENTSAMWSRAKARLAKALEEFRRGNGGDNA
ncbi:RNA polymerase sigma factor [Dactylosporangium sp. CA-139066]|uniref:RNA polymerase sigma factor n=1 Tax=Dactylosporangium sp. CA-139066 TaxID=3239930 RepID=UPI003D8BAD4B